ncbi:MAG: 1,2-phenylacetyl-CoA epoxidase subunit PaaC [Bacteroidota bacterium]
MSAVSARDPSDAPLVTLLLALADDEFVLGHRDSEWTGHSPILEEDIAFSNIAQDEIGHSLIWFSLLEVLTGRNPDSMGFERQWGDFTCARFVTYLKGDFAYAVVRQYLFDAAERVRLAGLATSSYKPIKEAAEKILKEEAYHLIHTQGLVERLGDATEESHRRMQQAVDAAFPQALGMFEELAQEKELVNSGVMISNSQVREQWLESVLPVLTSASLKAPVEGADGNRILRCKPEYGGRTGNHTEHLKQLVKDLQAVYHLAPGGTW